MTPQEQQMLQGLTDRVNGTQLPDKDPEAEQYLQQSLSRNPDALYILAQTLLVQQYALDNAKKQIDQLRQQPTPPPAAPQKHTSFLGSLLGSHDDPPPPPPMQQSYSQPQYQPVQNFGPPPPQYDAPASYGAQPGFGAPSGLGGQPGFGAAPGFGGPQGGGFLRSAMQTATGVAAGALAFEGIESLMHGFGEHAGYGGGAGLAGMGGGTAPREEVINNYYGDDAGRGGDRDTLRGEADRADRDGGISPDIDDRRGDIADFADTSADDSSDTDDSSSFDNSSDDSSSFDSGGDDSNL